MKMHLTENQSIDLDLLQSELNQLPAQVGLSYSPDSRKLTIHGDSESALPIVEAHINAMTQAARDLITAKDNKKTELYNERLKRINNKFPAIADDNILQMMAEMWLSISAGSRAPTADWQYGIDAYQAAKQAAAAIDLLADEASVNTYDVVNTPSWPI